MSESFSTGRSHPERLLRLVTTVSVLAVVAFASVSAQITNPIARRWAAARYRPRNCLPPAVATNHG